MGDDERKKLEEQGIVFHSHSREERLKLNPENAKLYNGELRKKTGLFRVLLDAPGGKYMIFVIIILIGVIVSLAIFNKSNEDSIGGINTTIKAFAYEDKIYVNLKFDANKDAQKAVIKAELSAIDKDGTVIDTKELTDEYTGEELTMRTTFSDYELKSITAHIALNGEEKTVSVLIER